MKLLLAIALLASMSFASSVGGDETVGALPVINRQITGTLGEVIKLETNQLTLVLSTGGTSEIDETGFDSGTQDAIAPPEPHTVSWTSGRVTVTVTLYQQPGESDDGITIRLARRVAAVQKSFPPDPVQ